MSRSVLFDTETTGFDPLTGDRVIEIAAIELINDLPTDNQFHVLLDPERDIPADSTKVHGITNAHVEGKPKFADIVEPCWNSSATHRWSRITRPSTSTSSMPNSPASTPHPRPYADDRHAGPRQNPLPRDAQQPGRPLPPFRDRPLSPYHA